MPKTISYTQTLAVVSCTCGMDYAIPEGLYKQLLDHRGPSGKHAYCPLGHKWFYIGKTEADIANEKFEAERRHAARLTAQLDQERASHSATKGQLTKTKKRVANGVCPCCHRSFVQLARHMTTKHPNYTDA